MATAETEPAPKKLTTARLALFGLPDYAVYMAAIPTSLYLTFVYTVDLGLPLADVGLILLLARLSDVVTDPLIGYLSDRTQTRFGRRKPWLLAGAPLMAVAAFMLFNPMGPVSNLYLLGWSITLWLGWTMINIPYFAWGAELSDDYDERTLITGWRQAFGFLGNVSVLLVPVVAGQLFGYGGVPREGLIVVGWMALILLPLTVLVALIFVPERQVTPTAKTPLRESFRLIANNGSFKLLFFGFMLLSMGTAWAGPIFMLFAKFVLELEAQTQMILLGYYVSQLVSLPVWIWVAERIGKKSAWMTGAVMFVIVTPLFLLLGPGDAWGFFGALALYGVASGNFQAVSFSMKADVIDIASRRAGENVAGAYMAVWSLGQKLVQALAVGLALPILGMLGFDPKGDNGPFEIAALQWMYVGPPLVLYFSAIFVIKRYPISSERLTRVRGALIKREERRRVE